MGNMIWRLSVRGHKTWAKAKVLLGTHSTVVACWAPELGIGCNWVGTKAVSYSCKGCLGSEALQCSAAPLQSPRTSAPETFSKPFDVPVTPFTSMHLIAALFLTLDHFHRGVSAAGLGEAVSDHCWVGAECSPGLWGSNLACSPDWSCRGSAGGCSISSRHLVLQAVQRHRDTSPGPPRSKGHPDYNDHYALMWPKNWGNVGYFWFYTNPQGSRALALRPGWSWWVLKEEGKLSMHLEDSKEYSFATWWGHSCFLHTSLSVIVSLLCFTFYFLAFPCCFYSCPEILLLFQCSLPPLIPLVFSCLQLCLVLLPMGCFW